MSATTAHSIFASAAPLPRGPHQLSREQVAASQRDRLMAALTDLLAEHGYAAVGIGGLAQRAGVSRATFYEHFADKEACLLAAYDHFALTLLAAMTEELSEDSDWGTFVGNTLAAYLGTLEQNPAAARAFMVEMDGAGPAARRRRRQAVHGFAALLSQRHAAVRVQDPSLGPLPKDVWIAFAFAVRELIRAALEDDPDTRLTTLAPTILTLITAAIQGAAAAQNSAR